MLLYIVQCVLLLQHASGDQDTRCLKMEMKMIHKKQLRNRHEMLQALLRVDSMRITARSSQSCINNTSTYHHRRLGTSGFEMAIGSGAVDMGSALYFVELSVGTPPQKVLMVPDTGSNLVWVNCNPNIRSATAKPLPTFQPTKSSSLSYVPCNSKDCTAVSVGTPKIACYGSMKACKYSQGYMDGTTTSGPYIRENITLKSTEDKAKVVGSTRVLMGCGMENQPADSPVSSGGVLGLGQDFTSFAQQTLPLYGGKFSFCLRDYLNSFTVKNSLFFGDIVQQSSKFLKEPVQYIPIVKGGTPSYYVGVEGMVMNGKSLPISGNAWNMDKNSGNGGTIVDSGTSLTYFKKEAYDVIMKALGEAIAYPRATTQDPAQFDLCFNTSGVKDLKLPTFSIVFGGGKMFSPPSGNYVLEVEEGVGCVGFKPVSEGSPNIIGNLLQQNFLFQYDVQKSLLGFAPADCSAHN